MNNQLDLNIEVFCRKAIEYALFNLKENNMDYIKLVNELEITNKKFKNFLSLDENDENIKILTDYIWQNHKKTLLEMNAIYLKGVKDGIALKSKLFE